MIKNLDDPNRFLKILPPETQSLTLKVSHVTHNEASCGRLIKEILASPVRSTTLLFDLSLDKAIKSFDSDSFGTRKYPHDLTGVSGDFAAYSHVNNDSFKMKGTLLSIDESNASRSRIQELLKKAQLRTKH